MRAAPLYGDQVARSDTVYTRGSWGRSPSRRWEGRTVQGQGTPGPGPAPRTPEQGGRHEEVRTLVLDVATELFADRGIRGTTVRDIAAAAGVSHPLVHAYLGTKDAILAGVFARHGELARRHAADRDVAPPQLTAELARYVLGQRRDYARLAARAALEGLPFSIAEDAFPGTRALADYAVSRAGQRDGSAWFPGIGPRVLIASLVAMCIGWAAAGDGMLDAAGLEGLGRDDGDEQLVHLLEGVFRASLPTTGPLPPFPGAHYAAPARATGAAGQAPAEAPAPASPNRRGGRARATEQILQAAERLYGAGREPTMRDVADAAGVSHALVHRYAGSKEQLEALVLERNEERMIAATRHTGSVQKATVWSLREDLARGRPYLMLGARVALDGGPAPGPHADPVVRHLVTIARAQTEAAAAPAPFPGADPAFAVTACLAMATGWAVLDTWLPCIVGLDVPRASAFDENFLAVVDCALTAHIPE